MPRPWLLLATLLPTLAHAAWPPGETFEDGVVLDVTPAGFTALGDGLPALVPPVIDLPEDAYGWNFYTGDSGECCVIWCWTCWEYAFGAWNGSVAADVQDLRLVPRNGYLELAIDLDLSVNSASDPMGIYAYAEGGINDIGLSVPIDMTCDTHVDPFDVSATAQIHLSVVQGPDGRVLDAEIPSIGWTLGLSGNDLHLESCFLGDFIDFVQDVGGVVGFDPIGEIIGLLEGVIDEQIQALIPDLEAAIEDAFAQARVQETVDVGGTMLEVTVEPYDIDVTTAGARLQMAGSFDAAPNPCVAEFGIEGSAQTPSTLPGTGQAPAGITGHHLGAFVSDDFVDSGLFAAWRAGLLCYTLAESDTIPLNTTLLGIMSPDAYGDLFDEPSPVTVVTRPAKPPESEVGGANDLVVGIDDLGVDLYADLDYRSARLLGLDLATDVGIDMVFEPTTGELALDIAFDAGAIDAEVAYDEITVAHTEDIEGSLANLFETVMGPLVGGLISDVTFPIPSMEGFGVTDLEVAAAGTPPGWFGLFAQLGAVSTTGSGGCGSSESCSGGCNTGSAPGLLFALPALFLLRRRR